MLLVERVKGAIRKVYSDSLLAAMLLQMIDLM